MRVRFFDDSTELRLTHTIQQLLAFLVLRRDRPSTRDLLVDLFWSEYDQLRGRSCLNTALWRLRRAFKEGQAGATQYLFTNYLGEVCFRNSAGCWIDIVEFESCWESVRERTGELNQQDVAHFLRLLSLYQGDLLEGLYDDWILSARERFRLIHLECLARLMEHYHDHHEYEKSAEFGQRLLSLDPLREDVHRRLMQLYLDLGRRSTAVRQYDICCARLKAELNIAPLAETQALYRRALHDPGPAAESAIPGDPHEGDQGDGYRDALSRVEQAVESFESARSNLHQALQTLQRHSGTSQQDHPA